MFDSISFWTDLLWGAIRNLLSTLFCKIWIIEKESLNAFGAALISSIARRINFHFWIVGPFPRIASHIVFVCCFRTRAQILPELRYNRHLKKKFNAIQQNFNSISQAGYELSRFETLKIGHTHTHTFGCQLTIKLLHVLDYSEYSDTKCQFFFNENIGFSVRKRTWENWFISKCKYKNWQNCPFFSRILVLQIEKILEVYLFSNFENFKNFQLGKFQKLSIWEIQKIINWQNSKDCQFGKFQKISNLKSF